MILQLIGIWFGKLKDGLVAFWQWLPAWVRSTALEVVELVGVVVLAYTISAMSGDTNFDFRVLLILVLKAIAKMLRSNPNIPVPDYVNSPQE